MTAVERSGHFAHLRTVHAQLRTVQVGFAHFFHLFSNVLHHCALRALAERSDHLCHATLRYPYRSCPSGLAEPSSRSSSSVHQPATADLAQGWMQGDFEFVHFGSPVVGK
jgi:hypothetical protein